MEIERKPLRVLAVSAYLLAAVWGAPARAQMRPLANSVPAGTVPGGINYQGRLIDNGFPVTGTRNASFRLYDAASGGTLLWSSGSQAVTVNQGLFGTTLAISTGALAGQLQKYLEVQIDNTTLSPREPLNAVPYALIAKTLEENLTISSVTVGSSLISSGTFSVATLTGVSGLTGITFASSTFFMGGNIGIGTTSPATPLDVNGAAQFGSGVNKSTFSAATGGLTFAPAFTTTNPQDAATKNYVDVQLLSGGGPWSQAGSVVDLTTPGNSVLVQSTLTVQGNSFSVGGSTLVVTSGNVGIGTTNPGNKLQVIGSYPAITAYSGASNSLGAISIGRTAAEGTLGIDATTTHLAGNSNTGDLVIRNETASNNVLLLAGFGNAVLSVGSSNVGIGTTSPGGAIDVRDASGRQLLLTNSATGSNSNLNAPSAAILGGNAYWDQTNWNRFNTGNGASAISATQGAMIFFNVPAGANPITWTEQMRIASTGNVGIGTTNPGDKLEVAGGNVRLKAAAGAAGSVKQFAALTVLGTDTCNSVCGANTVCLGAWTSAGVISPCTTTVAGNRCLCAGFGD